MMVQYLCYYSKIQKLMDKSSVNINDCCFTFGTELNKMHTLTYNTKHTTNYKIQLAVFFWFITTMAVVRSGDAWCGLV